MTDQEVLQKAIEKAQKSGWKKDNRLLIVSPYGIKQHDYRLYFAFIDDGHADVWSRDWQALIFSHEFARVFWGEKIATIFINATQQNGVEKSVTVKMMLWQRYLQQMVLSENPIKYLEQFI